VVPTCPAPIPVPMAACAVAVLPILWPVISAVFEVTTRCAATVRFARMPSEVEETILAGVVSATGPPAPMPSGAVTTPVFAGAASVVTPALPVPRPMATVGAVLANPAPGAERRRPAFRAPATVGSAAIRASRAAAKSILVPAVALAMAMAGAASASQPAPTPVASAVLAQRVVAPPIAPGNMGVAPAPATTRPQQRTAVSVSAAAKATLFAVAVPIANPPASIRIRLPPEVPIPDSAPIAIVRAARPGPIRFG